MALDPQNDFRPGDDENVILRKILARLEFVSGGGGGGGVTQAYVDLHDALTLAAAIANASSLYVLKSGDTMTGLLTLNASVNVITGQTYRYNGVQVLQAITALDDYFFGNAGNLTMTGINNTGGGFHALNANTSGVNNTAFGVNALSLNTTASQSTAVGAGALQGSTGASNTAVGNQALQGNTTGITNLAIGDNALRNSSTLSDNIAIGFQALLATTTAGTRNIAIGSLALTAATTGDNNVAIGFQAMQTKLGGTGNTSIGFRALSVSTGGNANTAVGSGVGILLTSGSNNTLFGFSAGDNLTTGSKNIILGHDIDAPVATGSNQMSIGNAIFGVNISGTGTTVVTTQRIGIGIAAPTAKLHIQTQTSSAPQNAPLKFEGFASLLVTPELGAFEHQDDGTNGNLFFTQRVAGVVTRTQLTGAGMFVLKAGDTMTGLLTLDAGARTGAGQSYDYTTNLAIGTAFGVITSGTGNLAIGASVMTSVDSGSSNIGIGNAVLFALTSGSDNIVIGNDGGVTSNLTTGSRNVIIGLDPTVFDGTASDQLNIAGCIYGSGLLGGGAGFIGIGTNNPIDRLSVFGDTGFYESIINATDFSRLRIFTDSGAVNIWTDAAGGGTLNDLVLGADATELQRFQTGGKLGFFAVPPVVQQASGANFTNNITAGGTDDAVDNYTDLTVYANSASAIHNNLYQLARKMKQVNDALRAFGLLD